MIAKTEIDNLTRSACTLPSIAEQLDDIAAYAAERANMVREEIRVASEHMTWDMIGGQSDWFADEEIPALLSH